MFIKKQQIAIIMPPKSHTITDTALTAHILPQYNNKAILIFPFFLVDNLSEATRIFGIICISFIRRETSRRFISIISHFLESCILM